MSNSIGPSSSRGVMAGVAGGTTTPTTTTLASSFSRRLWRGGSLVLVVCGLGLMVVVTVLVWDRTVVLPIREEAVTALRHSAATTRSPNNNTNRATPLPRELDRRHPHDTNDNPRQEQPRPPPHSTVPKNDDWDNDDPLVLHNQNLIRPRPRGLRLMLVGDSTTRYQYLSLAYWLRYGRWFDHTTFPNHLVDAHSFHHAWHPQQDWNEFFLQTNRLLSPLELCDCFRETTTPFNDDDDDDTNDRNDDPSVTVTMERRYFWDRDRDNRVVFILLNGNQSSVAAETVAEGGYVGRVDPHTVFSDEFEAGLVDQGAGMGWLMTSWEDVVQYHLGGLNWTTTTTNNNDHNSSTSSNHHTHRQLRGLLRQPLQQERDIVSVDIPPRPTILLNAGLHPHNFNTLHHAQSLRMAIVQAGFYGMWRTTTFARHQLVGMTTANGTVTAVEAPSSMSLRNHTTSRTSNTATAQFEAQQPLEALSTDHLMCAVLEGCMNISWTRHLRPDIYFDKFHFREPVYRILNEDWLGELGVLPPHYQALERSAVLALANAAGLPLSGVFF